MFPHEERHYRDILTSEYFSLSPPPQENFYKKNYRLIPQMESQGGRKQGTAVEPLLPALSTEEQLTESKGPTEVSNTN